MTTPRPRGNFSRFGLKRVFALTVAPAVLASAVIFATNVPTASAAAAVPNTVKLAGSLAQQKIVWETCDFGADLNDRYNKPNVSCATVKVPRDWHNPGNGKTWDIRISQAKNRDVKDGRYLGTIFANPGGPGGSGLVWGSVLQERTPDLRPYYNYVGFDPRGVGQSSHTSCDYTWDSSSTDPDAELKAAAAACSANEDVKTITTEQTAYDMDFIRALLKAPKLSYIGYSYGTWLGAWYEKVFGTKYGDKFVLDSSLDVTAPTLESGWDLQPIARDRQFRTHLMNWIARHDDEYKLGTDPVAIHERYFAASANVDPFVILLMWVLTGAYTAFPNNAEYPLAAEVVAGLIGAGEAEGAAPSAKNPAAQVDAILATMSTTAPAAQREQIAQARQDVKPLLSLRTKAEVKQQQRTAAAMETGTLEDVFDFIRCNDGQWTQGAAYWNNHNAQLAAKAPLSASWGLLSTPVCAFWQTNNLMPVANGDTFPKTIVVQGELDSQTGWEGGYRSGIKLPNTSLIAIDNEGSHGHFPYGTEAVDRPIINYFLKGTQPKNVTVAQALPLPLESVTYESWAKLDRNARHIVGENTNPTLPAGSAGTRTNSTKVSDLLAAHETAQLARQQVLKVYGPNGVKALDAALR